MNRMVAGLVAVTLAGSLAGCGSPTANDTAPSVALANDTVLNDELPADENALTTDEALDNGAADNLLTPTDNAL